MVLLREKNALCARGNYGSVKFARTLQVFLLLYLVFFSLLSRIYIWHGIPDPFFCSLNLLIIVLHALANRVKFFARNVSVHCRDRRERESDREIESEWGRGEEEREREEEETIHSPHSPFTIAHSVKRVIRITPKWLSFTNRLRIFFWILLWKCVSGSICIASLGFPVPQTCTHEHTAFFFFLPLLMKIV